MSSSFVCDNHDIPRWYFGVLFYYQTDVVAVLIHLGSVLIIPDKKRPGHATKDPSGGASSITDVHLNLSEAPFFFNMSGLQCSRRDL